MRRSKIFEFLNTRPTLTGIKIKLRSRRIEDAADEYTWRTDEELCRLDATIPIFLTFTDFFERYLVELEYPGLTYTLSIDTVDGKHIGECSLFNLDFLSASTEIGIMIGEKTYWDLGYGTDAIQTFLSHIFCTSDIDRIFLRTLEWNKRALTSFEKCGFKICGSLTRERYDFVLMEIHKQQWLKTVNKLRSVPDP